MPDENIIEVKQWPYNATELKDGAIKFAPVVATIAGVFTKFGVGWKFVEDDTPAGEYKGVIWDARGPWNEDTKKRDPYAGPKYAKGDKARVVLATAPGDKGTFYRVLQIERADGAPGASAPEPQAGAQSARSGGGNILWEKDRLMGRMSIVRAKAEIVAALVNQGQLVLDPEDGAAILAGLQVDMLALAAIVEKELGNGQDD